MRSHRLMLPGLLVLLALPAFTAPPRSSSLRSDILYTQRGDFLQVSPMRQLTLNSHIQQFAYEPLGLEVAFVGSEARPDGTVNFVKTMDVRSGHEMSRLTFTAPSDSPGAGFSLLGWSGSGKYLLLHRTTPDPQDAAKPLTECLRWDLSASPPVTRLIDPAAHLSPGAQADFGYDIPSPHGRWIVFSQSFQLPESDGKLGTRQVAYLLYDPERDTFRTLRLPPEAVSFSWADEDHLAIRQNGIASQFDVATGRITPSATNLPANAPAVSKYYPELSLDVEARSLEDTQESGGRIEAHIVWIRKIQIAKKMLGVAAAGLTPGEDDPQAVWSPTGRQVAFIAHGDLCVTDLTPTAVSLSREKLAVGLPITETEERMLAASSVKQIGMALAQYTQDNDERFPSENGLREKLAPYLPADDVFQINGHSFAYQAPPSLVMADMEAPAETIVGYMDLRSGQVALFADGHVKWLRSQGSPTPNAK